MLSENIKAARESKGLSQEELAVKLSVVRQTVSKWERGLSVPDADLLIRLSEELETPVSTLLSESVAASKASELEAIAEKLEVVNLQLARQREVRGKAIRGALVAICAITVAVLACLAALGSPYARWDFTDPELAVAGTIYHAFEWVFFRVAPIVLAAAVVALCLARKRA